MIDWCGVDSKKFTVETASKETGKKYKQTWTDNMGKCGKASITSNGRGDEFTRVSFTPDLKRFGMERIDEDTVSLLKKRVYDMAGTIRDVKVFLNGERLKVKGFTTEAYCLLKVSPVFCGEIAIPECIV